MATDDNARLLVTIEAKLAQFEKQMAQATGGADRAARKIETRFNTMERKLAGVGKGLLAAFGVGFVTGGLAEIVRAAGQAVSAVADLADAAGRAGVSAEKLQVLRHALEQNGASAADADAALSRLTKTIGEAATTSKGPAADTFRALGISVRDASGAVRSTDAVFADVVDRLSRVGSQAEAAAIGAKLFGREAGSALAPTLRQGSAALADFETDLRSTGSLMSDELVAKADELDDRFKRLSKTIGNAFKIAAVEVADAVADIISEMVRLAASIPKPIDAAAVGAATGRLIRDPKGARIDRAFETAGSGVTDEELRRALLLKRLGSFDPGGGDGRDSGAAAAERQRKAIEDLIAELQFENQIAGQSAEAQRVLTELRRLGTEATDDQAREVVELVQENIRIEQSLERIREAQERFNDAMRAMGEEAGDAFARVVIDGERAADVIRELVAELARAAIRSAFLNLFTGGGGGGLLGSIFGGHRANGGPVMPGRSYVVGEKGPEIFSPSAAGRIHPNGGVQRVEVDNRFRVDPSPLFVVTVQQAQQSAIAENNKRTAELQRRYG